MLASGDEVLARLSYENEENEWYVNPQLTGNTEADNDTNWFEVRSVTVLP